MAKDFYHNNVREALEKAKIIVYNPHTNTVVQWIK
jgi:hypothetical protein